MRKDKTAPRSFACPACKAVIGMIIKDADFVERLNVFRQVFANGEQPNFDVLVTSFEKLGTKVDDYAFMFSVIHFDSGTLICPGCNAPHEWNLSKAALDRLLTRRRGRTFGLDV